MSSDDSNGSSRGKAAASSTTAGNASTRRYSRYALDPVSLGLRKLWQDVEKEPVPDEFLALLDEIDAAQASSSTDSKS